jgi:hypothetical protein
MLKQRFSTIDIHLATLLALFGIQPTLELKDRTVIFTFPVTEKLYEYIFIYNSNPEVKLGDFLTLERALRAKMSEIKKGLK